MITIRILENGHVIREEIFKECPIKIGRAPENDLILGDPSVSLNHAMIERSFEGGFVLTDLQSQNKVYVKNESIQQHHFLSDVCCFLGSVELEIRVISQEESTSEVAWVGPNRRRSVFFWIACILSGSIGYALIVFCTIWPWDPQGQEILSLFLERFVMGAAYMAGAGIALLIVLQQFKRKIRLADTLFAVSLIPWLRVVTTLFDESTYYYISPKYFSTSYNVLISLTAGLAAAYLVSLRATKNTKKAKALWFAAVFSVWWFSEAIVPNLDREKRPIDTRYSMYPPLGKWTGPTKVLDAFMNDVDKQMNDKKPLHHYGSSN